MDVKDILSKVSKKEGKEKVEAPKRELVKFDRGVLDKYSEIEIRYAASPSAFGVRMIAKPKAETQPGDLPEGMTDVVGTEEKVDSLIRQMKSIARRSEEEKYKRIMFQSRLVTQYRQKGMEPQFIEDMIALMPLEYELTIYIYPKRNTAVEKSTVRVFYNDPEHATQLLDELMMFRERSLNSIVKEKVDSYGT